MKKIIIKVLVSLLGIIMYFTNYKIGSSSHSITGIFIIFILNLIIGLAVFRLTKSYINNFIITVFSNTFFIVINVFTMIFSPSTIVGYEVILIFLISSISINIPCLLKILIGWENKQSKIYLKLLSAYFAIGYFILLANLLFVSGRYGSLSKRVSLIPFKTISSYLESIYYYKSYAAIINIVGNIVLFIPIGFIISIYIKNKLLDLIILLLISISIEILQFIMALGVTDIDDVILNFSGELIGAFIFLVIKFLYNKKSASRFSPTATEKILN